MDQRNLLLAMALSIAILFGYSLLFPPAPPPPPAEVAEETAGPGDPPSDVALPSAAPGGAGENIPAADRLGGPVDRAEALARSPRVQIESGRLAGSLALRGGRIDDLTLTTYRQTLEPDSPPIRLLSPSQGPDGYFAEFGWIGEAPGMAPGADALWQATDEVLEGGGTVTMTWQGETGLVFEREIALDEGYMFTISDTVRNTGEDAATLRPYGLVSRAGEPNTSMLFVLHEGPLGVLGGTLEEVDYDDLADAGGSEGAIVHPTRGGWIGITDVYWLAAVIPDQASTVRARFLAHNVNGVDRFQTDYASETGVVVPPGETASFTHRFFGGAKEVRLLDRYQDLYDIDQFDKAIDFGWFYFLTKPFFYALDWLYGVLGNFGLAIMAFTVCVKLVFFPLANKSYKSMSQMKALQPEMMKLRERYGDDRQKLNQEMMKLYKDKKVNPAAGCLPILIQIPVFFALYKVLIVTIEMRHAPFFGWIEDLSAPDPTSVFNLFGLLPYDPQEFLPFNIGAWAIAMGLTMFFQQRLNPQPTDPVQAKIFALMPIVFTFLLANFAAGLVIYWTWNNLLSITQQAVIMKRQGVPIGRRGGRGGEKAGGKA